MDRRAFLGTAGAALFAASAGCGSLARDTSSETATVFRTYPHQTQVGIDYYDFDALQSWADEYPFAERQAKVFPGAALVPEPLGLDREDYDLHWILGDRYGMRIATDVDVGAVAERLDGEAADAVGETTAYGGYDLYELVGGPNETTRDVANVALGDGSVVVTQGSEEQPFALLERAIDAASGDRERTVEKAPLFGAAVDALRPGIYVKGGLLTTPVELVDALPKVGARVDSLVERDDGLGYERLYAHVEADDGVDVAGLRDYLAEEDTPFAVERVEPGAQVTRVRGSLTWEPSTTTDR